MTCSIPPCNCGESSDVLSQQPDTDCKGIGRAVTSAENRNLIFTGGPGLSSSSGIHGLDTPKVSLDMRGKIPILAVATPSDEIDSADWQSGTSKCIPASAPVNIIKTDPAVKSPNKPTIAKIKSVIKKIKEVLSVSFVVITTVLLTALALAGTFGLSFPPLVLASAVVYVLCVVWRACNADKKDWVAVLIGSWASNKARAVQSVAAGFIAGVSAKVNGADLKAIWLASKFSFYKSRSYKNEGCTETSMACANAAGRSVARVQKLEAQKNIKASKASYAGAMAGASIGTKINGAIEGSSKIGELAGSGAFNGASVGRKVDVLGGKGVALAMAAAGSATVLLDAYWRFWLPEIFPAQQEGERSAGGDDRLSRSADLSKYDGGYVTALVNGYWRFWLHDAVAPVHSQRSAFTVGNDVIFFEKDELAKTNALWRESRESPSIVHGDSRVDIAMPNVQRTDPVRDRTAIGDVDPGLGEWFGAYTGGITGGIYAGLEYRSSGRFKHAASSIGQQMLAVRNFMGTGTAVSRRNNSGFPEID